MTYNAAAHHQKAPAEACLTAYYRQRLAGMTVLDPDWANIAAIRLTRVQVFSMKPAMRPGDMPRPYRLAQVVVQCVVRWRIVGGSPNGPGLRFIYVVREQRASPWRIGSIGSGP